MSTKRNGIVVDRQQQAEFRGVTVAFRPHGAVIGGQTYVEVEIWTKARRNHHDLHLTPDEARSLGRALIKEADGHGRHAGPSLGGLAK